MSSPPEIGRPDPEVTVVLPVRNEGTALDTILGDLLAQDFPAERMELLVVDGASTDDTRARAVAAAARDARVRVLDNPRRLSSAARAIGSAAARGRFVAYVDGHCRIESRTLLRDMVELFERTNADCLARPQPLVPSTDSARARAIAAARSSPFGHGIGSEIYGEREGPTSPVSSGAMYRREVFQRVGTFDPDFDACEDVEFNWRVERAGLSCWTSPKLAIAYEPRRTYGALFRQMRRYGLGRARLARKHRGATSLATWVPPAFAAGVFLLPLVAGAALVAPRWAPLLLAPYALYVLLAVAFGLAAALRAGLALLPGIVTAFPVVHLGLGIGFWEGLLRRPAGSTP